MKNPVVFTVKETVEQTNEYKATVPDDVLASGKDVVEEWLRENCGEWSREACLDESTTDVNYRSLKLEDQTNG